MRITEINLDRTLPPSSDKLPPSLQNLKMFVIPVTGRGIADVRGAQESFTSRINLWMNGWLMLDGIVKPISYTGDRQHIVVEFSGTVPSLAPSWRLAKMILDIASFEVMGQNLAGQLRDVSLEIGHIVNWCRPNSLEGWSLIGADRS